MVKEPVFCSQNWPRLEHFKPQWPAKTNKTHGEDLYGHLIPLKSISKIQPPCCWTQAVESKYKSRKKCLARNIINSHVCLLQEHDICHPDELRTTSNWGRTTPATPPSIASLVSFRLQHISSYRPDHYLNYNLSEFFLLFQIYFSEFFKVFFRIFSIFPNFSKYFSEFSVFFRIFPKSFFTPEIVSSEVNCEVKWSYPASDLVKIEKSLLFLAPWCMPKFHFLNGFELKLQCLVVCFEVSLIHISYKKRFQETFWARFD